MWHAAVGIERGRGSRAHDGKEKEEAKRTTKRKRTTKTRTNKKRTNKNGHLHVRSGLRTNKKRTNKNGHLHARRPGGLRAGGIVGRLLALRLPSRLRGRCRGNGKQQCSKCVSTGSRKRKHLAEHASHVLKRRDFQQLAMDSTCGCGSGANGAGSGLRCLTPYTLAARGGASASRS